MRSILLIAVSAGVGLVAGVLVSPREPHRDTKPEPAPAPFLPKSKEGPPQKTPPKQDTTKIEEPDRHKEIPLSSLYCANWSKEGLRVPRRKDDEEFTEMWDRLRKRLTKLPYRTAFVVQVATIEGAVSDTLDVLDGRREGGEGFALSPDFGRKDVWAVMFLGNTDGFREVTCTSATYSANELTVTVRVSQEFIVETVGISVPNLYWVPLPEVKPGLLTLRIHDSETKSDLLVVRTDIQ
ncbi:MAG: hypothetical protein K8U57_03980 [Planctomycetes bacterium]|nr:hypothetical protein [Planctomycetota bacterium]